MPKKKLEILIIINRDMHVQFKKGDLVLYNPNTTLIKSWAEGSPRKSLAVVLEVDEQNDYALMYYFANNQAIWTLINENSMDKYGCPYTILNSPENPQGKI